MLVRCGEPDLEELVKPEPTSRADRQDAEPVQSAPDYQCGKRVRADLIEK
jgi:hypothetical protein